MRKQLGLYGNIRPVMTFHRSFINRLLEPSWWTEPTLSVSGLTGECISVARKAGEDGNTAYDVRLRER